VVKRCDVARGLREIQARLRELAELRESATGDRAGGRAGGDRRSRGELRRALIDAHDQLLRRDAEIEAAQKVIVGKDVDIENIRKELDRVNDELVAALGGLEQIRTSAFYRLAAAVKSLLRR